jgi:hypothetical protein
VAGDVWITRADTERDVGHSPLRLVALRRVVEVGDLYLRRTCVLNDRWRALFAPGPRAGLQPLRPMVAARAVVSLYRGRWVHGVLCPELFGLTVRLRLTRGGELALLDWTRRANEEGGGG